MYKGRGVVQQVWVLVSERRS